MDDLTEQLKGEVKNNGGKLIDTKEFSVEELPEG